MMSRLSRLQWSGLCQVLENSKHEEHSLEIRIAKDEFGVETDNYEWYQTTPTSKQMKML